MSLIHPAASDFAAMERALDDAFSAVLRSRFQGVSAPYQAKIKRQHEPKVRKDRPVAPAVIATIEAYEAGMTAKQAAAAASVTASRVYQIAARHNLTRWRRQ